MNAQESELRSSIVRVARTAAQRGLLGSSDGNLSVRLGADRFLVTPSGVYKAALEVDDPMVVDAEGEILERKPGTRPTSELSMHLMAYRQRPDVNAAFHAHPPHAMALTMIDQPLPVDFLPEVLIALGEVPTAPYATPGTPALADSIRDLIRTHDTVLLSHHGSFCVGRTLDATLIALERLEHAAHVYYLARTLGTVVPLPAGELDRLREIGRKFRAG
jgi:L-fuculose-phosphate aldolase